MTEYIGAGLTLISNDNENYSILMAKSNSNNPNKKYAWIFAGGRRNDGECAYQTAYREFVEEIFNVVVDKKIIDEIITLISDDPTMFPIDTVIPNTSTIPSYTFIQTAEAITIFVNVLNKHGIRSNVFPFGYRSLYNSDNTINIFQFCMQRRYINEVAEFEKNELVFITMIPINNLLYSISRTMKHKDVFHYHGENLKIYVPSIMKQIKSFLNDKEFNLFNLNKLDGSESAKTV